MLIRALYFDAISCGSLPAGVDLVVYDFGFGAGEGESARLLQGVIGVEADGDIGPETIAAVAQACATPASHRDLITKLWARHEAYYENLKQFPLFGRGWSRRNAARVALALSWVDQAAGVAGADPVVAATAPASPPHSRFAAMAQGIHHAFL